MKKILVMPVKNEDWILETSLACASLWADHIIVADQNSTDRSRQIYKKFSKVRMIENSAKFHSSNVRKMLLDEARKFEGNNVIFSFDADEIPTSEILRPEFWTKVESLPVGSSVEMLWVNLWRSVKQYRSDGVQAPAWKHIGFIDDRKTEYTNLNVINDHTSRVPLLFARNSYRFEDPKILHYQFANWDRTQSKQVHYRMTEWLQKDKTWLNALKINLKYFPSKDERDLVLKNVPDKWMAGYELKGVEIKNLRIIPWSWHNEEIFGYFYNYGVNFFKLLDIWDVDWKTQQKNFFSTMSGSDIYDPRGVFGRFYQAHLAGLYSIYRCYRYFKNK